MEQASKRWTQNQLYSGLTQLVERKVILKWDRPGKDFMVWFNNGRGFITLTTAEAREFVRGARLGMAAEREREAV